MEPLLPDGNTEILADLTTKIIFEAGRLAGCQIPERTRKGIEKVVQQMNSYYSNLIEGHKTSPLEVEKALRKDFDRDPKKKGYIRISQRCEPALMSMNTGSFASPTVCENGRGSAQEYLHLRR